MMPKKLRLKKQRKMTNKVAFISLGCDKNLTDSEKMLALINDAGYELCDDESEASVIVVNTCCFISDAMEESINELIRLSGYYETGSLKALIACGCLAERYADEIKKEIPEVSAIVGTNSYDEIVNAITEALEGTNPCILKPQEGLPKSDKRILSTPGHYAYLKIAEGCNKNCTYCVIPSIRGPYRSFPIDDLYEEATKLAKSGVKELILVAQETTLYGIDLYKKKSLPKLIDKLSDIEGIEWIRLCYCYPEEINDELIECMANNPKVVHYIDMPIQHASDKILKAMGRRTDRASLINTIDKLRKRIPDICLRTTLISGFPGETDDDHKITLDFVENIKFDRLGVFAYSMQEGTPAAQMPDQIDEEQKEIRRDEILTLQQSIVFDQNENSFKDRVLTVITEGYLPENEVYVGRTYRDAPDVDGLVFYPSKAQLMTGDMVHVRITGSNEYDLIGELADESAQ